MITSLYVLWSRFQTWNDRRITIKQLSALNDHLLKDIGLDRYDIHQVANELAESTAPRFADHRQNERNQRTITARTELITPIPLPGVHR